MDPKLYPVMLEIAINYSAMRERLAALYPLLSILHEHIEKLEQAAGETTYAADSLLFIMNEIDSPDLYPDRDQLLNEAKLYDALKKKVSA